MHYNNLSEGKYDSNEVSSRSETYLDSENVLNVEPAEFPVGSGTRGEREGLE